ncbi:extracellular solute-binding protein [Paenibacillus qinlingensis]|uniref:Aldouronate transport system substrate-binding protein n=1 Tax=Paenibacillus qinlingensis TaxID=1837343 RepID=A0ABU1NYG6_9BACL|nr:extracellular solute-binding protein [Paenibacillus qinlingensis]MDR6552520.1 putative aldouronate transport system substrate-binding protein [Paenibacillus qinlingensis]
MTTKNKVYWKTATSLSLIVALSVVATACGEGTEATTKKEASKAPIKLNMMYETGFSVPSTSADSNAAVKYLQDKLGVQLEYNIYTSDTYKEKLRVQIASGDIPDIFSWNSMDGFIVGMIKSGQLVPVDELLDKYPNLKKHKDYEFAKYEGKTWAFANVRNPMTTAVPLIRQDWLDNLGLKAPTTIDELYEVAKAFTYNDPDKDGKKDTYGIQISYANNDFGNLWGFQQAYGIQDSWIKQDGKYVPNFATPVYKEYLTWLAKAFKEGLIDPDFAVTDGKTANAKVTNKNQAGIYVSDMDRINEFEAYAQANPKSALVPFEPVKGPHGDQGIGARVNYGGLYIPKKTAEDKAKLDKLMEWLDWGAGPEGMNFYTYGVEGVHYTMKDNKPAPINGMFNRDVPAAFLYAKQIQPTEETYLRRERTEATQQIIVDGNKKLEKYLKMPNASATVYSPTGSKYGAEANTFINTNIVKVIMGTVDVKDWDGIVKQWYDRFEGSKWQEEINAGTGGK